MSLFRSRLARQGQYCGPLMPVPVIPILSIARVAPKPMYPLPLPFQPEQQLQPPPAIVPVEMGEYPPREFAPPGTILSNKTGFMPPGYLVCDGSAVSRTQYATLFTIIGTYYGEGDSYSTFNVPNLSNACDPYTIYIIKYDISVDPSSCCPTAPSLPTFIPISLGVSGSSGSTGGIETILLYAIGPTGAAGRNGQDGTNGQDGQDGVMGPTGIAGETGIAGSIGPTGEIVYITTWGPTGSYSPPYPSGPTGSYYINPTDIPVQIFPYPLAYIPAPGTILYNTFGYVPNGYFACDGSQVSRIGYSFLFDMIGEYYGPGDGITTFNIPLLANGTFPAYRYIIRYEAQLIPDVIIQPDLHVQGLDLSNSSVVFS